MHLDNLCLAKYFTLPNRDISHLRPGTNPFNFVSECKDTLLVTIGDSWTWGDDLGVNRQSEVFGHILSKMINADFLNLSSPGAGNQYMRLLFSELSQIANQLTYKKIVVVITFTEVGRDFNGWFDRTVDYRSWLGANINLSSDYNKFLGMMNRSVAESIRVQAQRVSNMQLIVATNFVNTIGLDPLDQYCIEKSWLDICYETLLSKPIDGTCYFVSDFIFEKLIGVLELNWDLNRGTYLDWANASIDAAKVRLAYLKNNKFFLGLNHPTVLLHKTWAEYLVGKINA